MEVLLLKYGYVLLFLGVIVEGEAFLIAGAFLAQRGYFELPVVIAVAMTANAVANQFYYRAARARGQGWLERRSGARARYRRIIDRTARHGPLLLLGSRFAYGFVSENRSGSVDTRPRSYSVHGPSNSECSRSSDPIRKWKPHFGQTLMFCARSLL